MKLSRGSGLGQVFCGFVLLGLLVAVMPLCLRAGDLRPVYHHRFGFSGGIELARRSPVRNWYGTAAAGLIGYEHRITQQWGWEADIKARYSAVTDNQTKFLACSLIPMITRSLVEGKVIRFSLAAGPGLGYRVIWMTGTRMDEIGNSLGELTVHQSEIDLFAQAAATGEVKFGYAAIVARVGFDRWLTGHPSRGDFGDTGGYCFTLGLVRLF